MDTSPAAATCSFEDIQNGTIQKRWEPHKQTTASENKQDCSLPVYEDKNMEEKFDIPYDIVRYIVGGGRETIMGMQQQTGCRIAISHFPAVGGM